MRRRSFLALLAFALLSPWLGRASRAVAGVPAAGPAWSAGVAVRAARLGRAYLRDHPEEADPARLRALLREAGLGEEPGPSPRARTRIRDDFEQGRTVPVRGWVLSRTEARLCALTALVA